MKQEIYKYQITDRSNHLCETVGHGELSSIKMLLPKMIFDYLVELNNKGQLNRIKLIHEDCICLVEKLTGAPKTLIIE